jgi:hypothetical protein
LASSTAALTCRKGKGAMQQPPETPSFPKNEAFAPWG